MSDSAARPTVSMLLPTMDRDEKLEKVLRTLVEEKKSFPGLEIIVIDGGSTDRVEKTVRAFAADIVYVKQRTRGLYAALNEGLSHARGDYVRMVSDDDGYVAGLLPLFAEYMRAHPGYAGVGGTATYVRVQPDGSEASSDIGSFSGEIRLDNYLVADSLVQCVHEAVFFRRDLLVRLGGWNPRYRVSGDLDLMFRVLGHGRSVMILPHVVLHARRGLDSVSRRHAFRARAEPLVSLFLHGHWAVLIRHITRGIAKRMRK